MQCFLPICTMLLAVAVICSGIYTKISSRGCLILTGVVLQGENFQSLFDLPVYRGSLSSGKIGDWPLWWREEDINYLRFLAVGTIHLFTIISVGLLSHVGHLQYMFMIYLYFDLIINYFLLAQHFEQIQNYAPIQRFLEEVM